MIFKAILIINLNFHMFFILFTSFLQRVPEEKKCQRKSKYFLILRLTYRIRFC